MVDQAQLGVDSVQESVAFLKHCLVTPNKSGSRRNMQELPHSCSSTKAKSLKSSPFILILLVHSLRVNLPMFCLKQLFKTVLLYAEELP